MIIQVRPAGLGCSCNGECESCKRGLGDASSIFNSILSALTAPVPIGSMSIPLWMVIGGGFVVASVLGGSDRRR